MSPMTETLEAVILTGPRRGEIVEFPVHSPQQLGGGDLETLNCAVEDLDSALDRVAAELRATLVSFRPNTAEA